MTALNTAVLCVLAVLLSHIGITIEQTRRSRMELVRRDTGTGNSPDVILPSTSLCGFRPVEGRIAGGHDVPDGRYGWIAAFGYYNMSLSPSLQSKEVLWMCAGSLVTNKHILTAAHCVSARDPNIVLRVVRIGVVDLNAGSARNDYELDSWIVHPEYNRTSKVNDIAIVTLKTCVTFTGIIKPICLPTTQEFSTRNLTGKLLKVAGWGATKYVGSTTTHMQEAVVQVWAQQRCKEAYKLWRKVIIDNRVFCASGNGTDACEGDSGGPLMATDLRGHKYYLLGIVAYGFRCADPYYPGVYTRVSEFMDWILQNLK